MSEEPAQRGWVEMTYPDDGSPGPFTQEGTHECWFRSNDGETLLKGVAVIRRKTEAEDAGEFELYFIPDPA